MKDILQVQFISTNTQLYRNGARARGLDPSATFYNRQVLRDPAHVLRHQLIIFVLNLFDNSSAVL